jgi:hypothetical protein
MNSNGTDDRVVEEFNAGLHGDQNKERILRGLVDATSLTAALLALNPSDARKPYFAHQRRIVEFFEQAVESRGSKKERELGPGDPG